MIKLVKLIINMHVSVDQISIYIYKWHLLIQVVKYGYKHNIDKIVSWKTTSTYGLCWWKGPKSMTDLYSAQLVSSKIGLWAWKRVIVMFWHLIIWEVMSRQWIQCLYVRHHAVRTIDIGALPILSQVEQENEMVRLEALHFPTWWTTFYTK